MAQQTQQAPDPRGRGDEELTIAEMTRLMDVAAALRNERLTAEQQLNIEETKTLLRKRLLESAKVSGDPVTDQEIDAAIEAYYERQHEFQPPQPGVETFLASVYVRRGAIAKVALAVATVAMLWWSVFAFGLVGPKRTERVLNNLLGEVQATAAVVEELAVVPDLKVRAAQLLGQAQAARESGDAAELQAIQSQLASQAALLRQEYTIAVVADRGEQSGIDRYFTDASGERVSGYYLIVQAESPDGQVIPMAIRDAETGKTTTVRRWAEQVPKEVYDQIAADKQADGVVDARVVATKESGREKPTVQITSAIGEPIARGRQITQW
jgi:hypothetical protein